MTERIQKILSAAGIASRRQAEAMMAEGRITVDGVPVSAGHRADPDTQVIAVDGVPIKNRAPRRYIMLYKPRGYVTTMRDEKGRKTVCELTADVGQRVYPIGRLDLMSEGLLLMTSDGEFANRMMHPRYEKEKIYRVTVAGPVELALPLLNQSMVIDGYTIRPPKTVLLKKEEGSALLEITIFEGRNRQIRKMCLETGLTVLRLKRIGEGALRLGNLRPGKWRDLTQEELHMLAPELFK